jgi:hypothetical protein
VSAASDLLAIGRRLAGWGYTVKVLPGWETRGNETLTPRLTLVHHTAAPVDIDALLRDGRPGVPGPLANIGGHVDGRTAVLIAARKANHAGVGTVANADAYGTEMTGPPLGKVRALAAAIQAAICLQHGWSAARVVGHKETARPEGRKPDPDFDATSNAAVAYSLADMPGFRAEVQRIITAGGPGQEADDMPAYTGWPEADQKALVTDVVNGLRDELRDYLLAYLMAGESNSVYRDELIEHGAKARSGYEVKGAVHDEARATRDYLRRVLMAGAATGVGPAPAEDEVSLAAVAALLADIRAEVLARLPEPQPPAPTF